MKEFCLLCIVLVSVSCANVEMNFDDKGVEAISLKQGEEVLLLEQSRGFPAGSFTWGLIPEDVAKVKIRRVVMGRTSKFYAKGLKPGKTRLILTHLFSESYLTDKSEVKKWDRVLDVAEGRTHAQKFISVKVSSK